MARVLWVGGTSALSRTYFEEVHPARGIAAVTVAAPAPPTWALPADVTFVQLDLTSEASVATLFSRLPQKVDALVLGVRCSLVWARPEEHEQLAQLRRHRRTLSNALTGMRLQVPVGGELNVGGVGGAQCRWTARAHSRGLDRAGRSEKVQQGGRNADTTSVKYI